MDYCLYNGQPIITTLCDAQCRNLGSPSSFTTLLFNSVTYDRAFLYPLLNGAVTYALLSRCTTMTPRYNSALEFSGTILGRHDAVGTRIPATRLNSGIKKEKIHEVSVDYSKEMPVPMRHSLGTWIFIRR